MSDTDKVKNKAEDMKGSVKKHVGDATDNEELEAEGRRDQAKASAKQAGESMKDAGRDAANSVKKEFDRK